MQTLYDLRNTVYSVHNQGGRPRVHGNGFVQLDLSDTQRMNVWGDARIRPQLVPSTIHDHTFSFKSWVVRGQLVHRVFNVYYAGHNGPYVAHEALTNHGEDRRLVALPNRYSALVDDEHLVREGEYYNFTAGRFHETLAPWPCVTVIEKTKQERGRWPRVLVPYNLKPDETFDRYGVEEKLLWKVIFDALGV